MIHVALVSAYPTEDAPYLGIWTMPLPYGGTVHVFSNDTAAEQLEAAGWTREDA